jgi:LmbE family N-acetylglucosaminyl deacetylase
MSEWLKEHVWKACGGQPLLGSNPSRSVVFAPLASKDPMPRRSPRRFLFRAALALLILGVTLCGRFLYSLHAANAAMQTVFLPAHVAPLSGASVLVVAPHCDDETLGVGGLIADASRRGCRVSVVFVTNGDGFPMAVSRQYRRLPLWKADYRRLARQRQKEARAALAVLGVPAERITFLGYPDGGIAQLWNRHWTPDEPYRSAFTGCTRSPYPDSFRRSAVYCGQDLMQDLETLLQRLKPDWLYVPHPGDDHPDHWATHCFAVAALEEMRDRRARLGADWQPNDARLSTYLVHRGDWPVPQGLHREARLVPPASMARLDTQWSTMTLPEQAMADKEAALRCYRSQTAVMKRFLTSFIRQDELFGAMQPELLTPTAPGQRPWRVSFADSTRDTLMRDIEGSADIASVAVRLAGERLRIRVTTRRPLSPRLTYTLRLHPLGRGVEQTEPLSIPIYRLRCGEPLAEGHCSGRELEVSVPLAALGEPSSILVGVDSRLGRVPIDRVSWRLLRLLPRRIGPSLARAPS